jgi:guanosine-3',5'-bis(diphosphate) 3'-pyrophosphohydrolase
MACAWWCACSTVEDTDTTFEELKREFGLKVADIVREVTDDKSMAKDVRTTDLAR